MAGKLIIFSAPSGAGKSTLVQHLLKKDFKLKFSISATSRPPRGEEKHGVEYYFYNAVDFKKMIDNQEFIEYEEVYENCYYGTLRSEVDRLLAQNKNVIFDIDVAGGIKLKEIYNDKALSIFISPPSITILHKRLKNRGTDSEEMIKKRILKADIEMTFAPKFDTIVINDDLEKSKIEVENLIIDFLKK